MAQNDIQPLLGQVHQWWSEQHLHAQDGLSCLLRNPCGDGCDWREGRSVEQMAYELRPYLKADAVRAAGLLRQPDAQVARQVAVLLLPTPSLLGWNVVVDVIELAGAQTVAEQDWALAGLAVAGVSLLLVVFVMSNRRS
ncbi:MAG: hypothetical protein ACLQPH_20230 [Acidimicrobiales bacterium]